MAALSGATAGSAGDGDSKRVGVPAADWAPGGLIGAVLPTSFLGGAYYQRLRSLVADKAPLARLVFGEQRSGVFAGSVLQETCLAVFRRGAAPSAITCSMQSVNVDRKRRPLGSARVAPERAELPWLVPRAPRDAALLNRVSGLVARLPDYGWKASTGPLVWNRHKPQIASEHTQRALPIVWASDLSAGRVQVSCARATHHGARAAAETGRLTARHCHACRGVGRQRGRREPCQRAALHKPRQPADARGLGALDPSRIHDQPTTGGPARLRSTRRCPRLDARTRSRSDRAQREEVQACCG